MPSPENLVKAVIAEIDRLGTMNMDQLHHQTGVGFDELLDMTFTLKDAFQELQNQISVRESVLLQALENIRLISMNASDNDEIAFSINSVATQALSVR